MGKNKTYSAEFKQEVIDTVLNGCFTYKQASLHYQIGGKCTVSKWVKRYLEAPDKVSGEILPSVSGKEHASILAFYQARIAELERENQSLKQKKTSNEVSPDLRALQQENEKLKLDKIVMDILINESSKLVGFDIEKKFGTK